MTLVEFLRARLDEEEAYAQSADDDDPIDSRLQQAFMPARILAEVEAKRRIIELYEQARTEAKIQEVDAQLNGEVGGLAAAVSLLVLPYADHPDYREEWKP